MDRYFTCPKCGWIYLPPAAGGPGACDKLSCGRAALRQATDDEIAALPLGCTVYPAPTAWTSPWDFLTAYSRGEIGACLVRTKLHLRSQLELVHALIDAGHEVPAEDRILAVQVRLRRMTGWRPWDND